jgi:hypothetical protein
MEHDIYCWIFIDVKSADNYVKDILSSSSCVYPLWSNWYSVFKSDQGKLEVDHQYKIRISPSFKMAYILCNGQMLVLGKIRSVSKHKPDPYYDRAEARKMLRICIGNCNKERKDLSKEFKKLKKRNEVR